MRLHSSYTSPYVRKVKIFLRETGLSGEVEEIYTHPADEPALRPLNPLGKIPVLETGEGEALYDSVVICAWLDTRHGGARRIPEAGAARWCVLRGEALADGLTDAANLRRNEALREPGLISRDFIARQDLAISHALLALDQAAAAWEECAPVLHDQISAAAALGYIAFRYGDLPWREHCPRLADWFARFSERESFAATLPAEWPGRPAPPPQSVPPRWSVAL
ncbi:MAG: glutathione S-transferase N-terminal domain-containing protein [Nisaea sp.]|uniref:glutathione S-transferase family protein n=1 Tax=Nisaea sp. TaxID=2024842 RepID=UPI001B0E2C38|nr:glutathione S-transferase N-terminal domain-containing protein [Nisaea sp.]MBO6562465.1 glutathione S-transferase N-terminal domain-containing protein [Nisaea sp.]